jgi:anti-anti-sigma regulatory factor
MLRIERASNGKVAFTLSGRIEREDFDELRRLFSLETVDHHHIMLDLKGVTLVDGDAAKFLAQCEADGIGLENCPAYVRSWIDQQKHRQP